jgi:hypothetical protein
MRTPWTNYQRAECLANLIGGLGAIAVALLLSGCAHSSAFRWAGITGGPEYQPTNIFCAAPELPAAIRRVAILPISVGPDDWPAKSGRAELAPILRSELGKTQRFEVATVTPEHMRQLTGRESWRPDEKLPHDVAAQLRDEFGCEAVLLVHLAPYQAYRPLKLGWNLKLVDLQALQIVWAADEVFDASDASVTRAAERYYRGHNGGLPGDDAILYSPRRFSQYTLNALFATLPHR